MQKKQQELRPEMAHTVRRRRWRPRLLIVVLALLALLAAAHFIAVSHLSHPSLASTQSCASLIHNTDYTQIVQIQPRTQRMAAVQFVNEVTGGQPSALIQVEDLSSQQKLDVYLYTCTRQQSKPVLNLIFKQQGLIKGMVDITQAHTLSVGQIDTTLPADSDALLLPLQQNVFQEYGWQNGSLHQLVFPGLYPVTSRSEAEALQDEANNGQSLPWTDPLSTARQMAQDLFQWPSKAIQATLKDKGTNEAHVLLEKKDTRIEVAVTLDRLIQANSKGLWWVTNAQSPGITLDQTQFNNPQSSPLQIQGTIIPTHEKITATLFNHTLSTIPLQHNSDLQADSAGHFSGTLTYDNLFPDQPALLLITTYPRDEDARLFLTNLILN
ncbi:hypothetical protein [Dictyobacter aurantiacus]|uniref:Bacterial spore germination immunoglobulin-like domain-containing protein n=1 Tax=Dictyobacter aurantiacus TaxID=1936993 RepID=A0A401Z8W7_9CHLR|nr:hypothetical protein [Dictyobacter aurantiacus]GCE03317.1 hypothetical protein KDAU_06460 [Dictyobacter aurantiacus]